MPNAAPSPTSTLWTALEPLLTPTSATPTPTSATPTSTPVSIWRVDYNAMVQKDAAMGWQGLGYVLVLNSCVFLAALAVFQRAAHSTRFSLYHLRATSASGSASDSFTLRDWARLLWRTPIQGTAVEGALGPEGTFYLVYQVYALRFLLALSVYALLVLLPLYLGVGARELAAASGNGTATDPPTNSNSSSNNQWWSFAHATIRSLPNESPFLWVPVATCYLFTAAFLFFVHRLSALCRVASPSALAPHSSAAAASSSPSSSSSSSARSLPHLQGMQPSALSLRSLFVDRGVPKHLREERVLFLLQEVFPGYLDDVCLVYNLADVFALQSRLERQETKCERDRLLAAMRAPDAALDLGPDMPRPQLSWSLRLLPGSMKFPSAKRVLRAWSSALCGACCRRRRADKETKPLLQQQQQQQQPAGVAFDEAAAQAELQRLREQERAAVEHVVRSSQGAGRAFLVFQSARHRARFVRRVRNASVASMLQSKPEAEQPRLKRAIRELGLTTWHLSSAPEPDDIDWGSVSFPFVKRTAVVVAVNVVILALLLVFTSPVAVTSALSSASSSSVGNQAARSLSDLVAAVSGLVERAVSPHMAKMMVSYVPTLILVMINAVLLNGLQLAGRVQPIATDSAKERLILRTAAVYLIFNTLFVPSLAFVSIDAMMLYLRSDGHQVLDLLGTLFLHNSGIFYVNYVLQRAFLGTAVHLLRLSEFAKFLWEKPRAVTPREHVHAVEAWPFFTGVMSAIQISMLTVVLTFSTVVPLMLPIGALYFGMQHAVDKYALLRVRPRIKGRGSIARTATHATIVSLLMYQGAMSGFFLVRGTTSQSSSVLALLMVTYIVCLWWYIRDKERAYGQTAKGHHVHGPHCIAHRRRRRRQRQLEDAGDGDDNGDGDGDEDEHEDEDEDDGAVRRRSKRRKTKKRPTPSAGAGHLMPPLESKLLSSVKAPWRYVNNVVQELEVRSLFSRPARPSGTSLSENDLGGPDVLLAPRESDEYRAPPLRKYGKTSALTQAVVAYARRHSMPLAYFNPHRTPVHANHPRRASFLAPPPPPDAPSTASGRSMSSAEDHAPGSSEPPTLTFSLGIGTASSSAASSSSAAAQQRPRSGSLPPSYGSFRLTKRAPASAPSSAPVQALALTEQLQDAVEAATADTSDARAAPASAPAAPQQEQQQHQEEEQSVPSAPRSAPLR
ncbi:hypothetical protein P43SY_005226 [Pythium insidiosum]|uniref:CSC1/OSCA1-like 7TM region domain-containing protein n=1 Tax=Pythium insidiosum TaxID=114742 RepID=A0AAD5M8N2_PYTIN|nr:hypothetical protein P43SY_005226 [Pythium insidiosum]